MIGSSERQDAVCALLKQSIYELCKASFNYEGNDVQIDGIICITTKRQNGVENAVVKIHDQLWSAKLDATEQRRSWGLNTNAVQKIGVVTTKNRALTPPLVRPNNKGLTPPLQRFEAAQKRKSHTPLVSLLTGAIRDPKVGKLDESGATNLSTGVGAPQERSDRSILKGILDTDISKATSVPVTAKGTEKETEKTDSETAKSKDILSDNQPIGITICTTSGTKPIKTSSKKGGLDSIVSNLSENARLLQAESVSASPKPEEKQVAVVHIIPEGLDDSMDEENTYGKKNENNNFPSADAASHDNDDKLLNLSSTADSGAIFICEFCEQCIEDRDEFIVHRARCRAKNTASLQNQTQFVCQLCHRQFADFNALSLHSRIHSVTVNHQDAKRESIWKGKPLTCGLCKCVLRSKRCLQEHMKKHAQSLNISPFSCVTCDVVFPDFGSFKQHRLSQHQDANNCRCEICDLFFTFKEFKTHEFECLNGNRGEASISNYTPATAATNYDVILKEQNVRVIQPETPDIQTGNDIENNDPAYENTNSIDSSGGADKLSIDESFDVNNANRSSPSTPNTNAATPIKSESPFEEAPCQGPYRCQSCFTVFENFNEYEVHNHEMHSRFVCSFCAQSFASRRNLTRHARRHTGIKPYQCSECPNTYTRDDDLKKHMNRVHGIKPMPKIRLPMKTALAQMRNGDSMTSDDIMAAIYNVPIPTTSPSMVYNDSDSNHDSTMSSPKRV